MTIRKADVYRLANALGVDVYTEAPGDGQYRYAFTYDLNPSGQGTMRCLGTREAWALLKGIEIGQRMS